MSTDIEHPENIRLNRFLASCGVGSRRTCDQMIQDGKIVVNGKVCTSLATRVSESDFVKIGNKRVQPQALTTVLFNKPRGYVCTKSDEKERETIYSLIPPAMHHLNHVGRLDADSEGLLVLTNDGDLAQALTHPRQKVEKEYLVTLNQSYGPDEMEKLLSGVRTPEGIAKAEAVARVSARRIRVILTTGLKRQIREMFKGLGLRVTKLVRLRVGSVWGGDLAVGRYETMTPERIALLMKNPRREKVFQLKHRTKAAKRARQSPKAQSRRSTARKAPRKKR